MDIITLTTDFGLDTEYSAAMKGVLLKINPEIRIIDITHSIKPQNVLQGAYILYSAVPYFSDSIHLGVVDPGVGTSRAGIIFKCHSSVLVGPDNGLLYPAAERLGIKSVFKITNREYYLKDVSSTFHGRDIFAPIAAHLSIGKSPEELGEPLDEFVKLNLFDYKETDEMIQGKVLNIDSFGNIITNIPKNILERNLNKEAEQTIEISSAGQTSKLPYKETYGSVPQSSLLALISSSGFLEIAGNQCNASDILNVKINDDIIIKKMN
jgi:S-adenosylmethionine hydrolase